jgi:hypothetical protein
MGMTLHDPVSPVTKPEKLSLEPKTVTPQKVTLSATKPQVVTGVTVSTDPVRVTGDSFYGLDFDYAHTRYSVRHQTSANPSPAELWA